MHNGCKHDSSRDLANVHRICSPSVDALCGVAKEGTCGAVEPSLTCASNRWSTCRVATIGSSPSRKPCSGEGLPARRFRDPS